MAENEDSKKPEDLLAKKPRPKSDKPRPKSSSLALEKPKGANKNRKRIGRGPGSGTGKTSARGQKGQKSRSGGSLPPGFEGGQLPIHRRLPKRGFTNIFRKEYKPLNLFILEKAGLTGEVTPEILAEKGLIPSAKSLYKVLGQGEIKSALSITADKFSKTALEKIEKAGGKAVLRK